MDSVLQDSRGTEVVASEEVLPRECRQVGDALGVVVRCLLSSGCHTGDCSDDRINIVDSRIGGASPSWFVVVQSVGD